MWLLALQGAVETAAADSIPVAFPSTTDPAVAVQDHKSMRVRDLKTSRG
jgi:hypothetical protein